MAQTGAAPSFRELSRDEIDAVLARNSISRLAYAVCSNVDVQPVSYVYAEGWLSGRRSYGRKYEVLSEKQYRWTAAACAVSAIEDPPNWRSVLVHGGFYVIDEDEERHLWEQAVRLLRTLIPATFSEDDPFASRTVLFRISVQDATGRASSRT